ncbi:hypothetical protein [Citrobacter sp. FDAARGOS_156]|uniref:hypothetical protein n=1 Tax=Citrobacter sp. FDAARGOS_156 TaxID=1702170 RepID=UPI001902A511|nr:hypothetical protein [Citrobacter sp. FDAARGOS_156]MBJ8885533.1 hypothetical protein [Citrobacter sp. FDAARGOS_156]HED2480544.1 hypothetical protein [Citrobacter youngae]
MTNYTQIMKEINKIISFCMVKGVQPHELVTSIFEREYQHIETYKKGELIHFILTYSDIHDDGVNLIKMKYVYNDKQQLLSISQKIDSSSYKIQWDRSEKLDALLSNLASQLPQNSSVISRLREAIPDDYKTVFYPILKVAC